MKKIIALLFVAIVLLINGFYVTAQEKGKIKVNADVVSSFLWRGVPGYSPFGDQNVLAPSIQPTLAFTYKNFEIGAWGSGDFTGTYKETDLYASYSYKFLTLMISDYYWNLDLLGNDYFDYNDESTSHILEAAVTLKPETFPVSLLVATMFYGADKKYDDALKNNYSTYVELGYSLPVGADKLDFALGMSPSDGFYGDGYGDKDGFSVVNFSVTGFKNIKISNDFELPMKAALIANPQHEKIYLVLGISL